jgi:hypothetical protein
MVTSSLNTFMTRIFGSRNERMIKTYRRRVQVINSFEPAIRKLSDAEMKARAEELSAKLRRNEATEADILPEAFAIMRESMDRNIGLRNACPPRNSRISTPTSSSKPSREANTGGDSKRSRSPCTTPSARSSPKTVPPSAPAPSTCSSSAAWCSSKADR